MRRAFAGLLFSLFLLSPLALAQPPEVRSGASDVQQDGLISGRLDDANPRDVFTIEGLRGEVIRFELSVTEGDLDPVLSVFDNSGGLALHRDDSAAGLGVQQDFTMEKTGRYFVVVARFGYRLGATAGDYELRMTRKGVLSEGGSTLRYNDSVIGTISDTNAEVYYTFQAEQGDILTISMVRSSGTLDPYLQVVDSERFEIANDHLPDEQEFAPIHGEGVGAEAQRNSGEGLLAWPVQMGLGEEGNHALVKALENISGEQVA